MKKLLGNLSDKIKKMIPAVLAGFAGAKVLSKPESLEKLAPWQSMVIAAEDIEMPPVRVWGDAADDYKKSRIITSKAVGVFPIPAKDTPVKIFKHGGAQVGKSILDIDFGTAILAKTLLQPDRRETVHVKDCMPIWSHYWGLGYYDFLFFIYAKALRIASVLTEERRRTIKIAYPLFNKSYEKELWQLAGFTEDQFIDTRKYKIVAENYFLSNNQSFYYHHIEDVERMQQVMRTANIPKTGDELIYVSRKGRRQLKNEEEVMSILKELGFTIIEDKGRPVVEQMAIFNNAKIIIGPHGAAFSNIIWCKPRTYLVELFPRKYFPPYYRYLAQILDLQYAALFEDNAHDMHFSSLNDDLYIDASRIKAAVEELLAGLPKTKVS